MEGGCLVFTTLIILYLAWLIIAEVILPFISLIPETLEVLALSAKQDWQIFSPFIIPLFWLLIRQVSIFLAQSLVLHLGFPPHWSKRIDQALGSFFGFLIIAVVWELPGPLTLGPLDDLWVRLSLTIMTLLFLIFTYLTQDFLPKRRLIRGLGSQNDDLRQQAAETLAEMGAEKLADIKSETKQEMVENLKPMGSAAVPALIQLLVDRNNLVYQDAKTALIELGSSAVPDLIQLLADQDVDICNHAIEILAEIGLEAVPDLIQRLGYEANNVGHNAAKALGKIGVQAIPELIQASKDRNSSVRRL